MDFAIFFAPDFSYIFRPLQDESDSTSKDRTTEGSKLNIRLGIALTWFSTAYLSYLTAFLFHKTFENAIFFATSKNQVILTAIFFALLNSGPEDYPLECRPKDFIKLTKENGTLKSNPG